MVAIQIPDELAEQIEQAAQRAGETRERSWPGRLSLKNGLSAIFPLSFRFPEMVGQPELRPQLVEARITCR
jgi:hypothetical protein